VPTMNRCKSGVVMMVFVVVLLVCGTVSMAQEFWADFVVQTVGEPLPVNGKIFVKKGLIRDEVMERGEKQITIVRPDKKVIWVINPEEKMYLEVTYQETDRKFDSWSAERESKAKYLGKEFVSALACKKYEVVEDGQRSTYWISEKLSFPIKIETKDSVMLYKNVMEGDVADDLFVPPADYEKMTMTDIPPAQGEGKN
jgi:hypothetical protein